MKKLLFILIVALAAPVAARAQSAADDADFDLLARKAARFFANEEWPNANAMYVLMLDRRPDDRDIYPAAIVSNIMAGDTARAMSLIPRAMNERIPIDTVLTEVRRTSFSIGRGDLYENFLLKTREAYPWYSRVINNYLLAYYDFRANGPELMKFASMMLTGLPDDRRLLRLLARGEMLSGLTDRAVATWHRLVALYPDDYDTILDLANYYAVTGRTADALTWFRRADALRHTPYVTAYLARHSPTPSRH